VLHHLSTRYISMHSISKSHACWPKWRTISNSFYHGTQMKDVFLNHVWRLIFNHWLLYRNSVGHINHHLPLPHVCKESKFRMSFSDLQLIRSLRRCRYVSRAELNNLIATRGVILYRFLCFYTKKVHSSHREGDVSLERGGYDSEVIHS